MTYSYKYIPASLSIQPTSGSNPKDSYVDLFSQTVKEQFYNSSNWWTIKEETAFGSQAYRDVDVRISHVINAETGLKQGDDWKTLYFSNIDHPIEMGKLFMFDDNVWLTTNTEVIKNLSATCTVRRCNNTLRWIDEPTGAYYEEPCAIEYLVKEPRDYATQGSPFITPGGFLHIETQFNERTNKIDENQRFLFGNPEHWTCYKVVGTGLNDFRNAKTYDNSSAKLLVVDMIANFVNNELDDVVNGIADFYTNIYTVGLSSSTVQGAPLDTIELSANVTYNGDSVTRDLVWSSSDTSIATVDSNGIVTFVATGSCVITSNILNNSASASCLAITTESPVVNNNIVISPNTNFILEGDTVAYSVFLYTNGVPTADVFAITCEANDVPSTSFNFGQTDGNHFVVTNILRNDVSHLTIQCNSGSGLHLRDFDIKLKGAW